MSTPPRDRPFTFSQLSVGLQILLILILVGSCSGGSNEIRNDGATSEVSELREDVQRLERQVRQLRTVVERSNR